MIERSRIALKLSLNSSAAFLLTRGEREEIERKEREDKRIKM